MTITVPNTVQPILFEELEIGDMFIYRTNVYIKIADYYSQSMAYCALNLTEQEYEDIENNTEIFQVVKNIIIEL